LAWQLFIVHESAQKIPGYLRAAVEFWEKWTHLPWTTLAGWFGAKLPAPVPDLLNFFILFFAVNAFTFYQVWKDRAEFEQLLDQGRWDERLESHEWDVDLLLSSAAACAIGAILMHSFIDDWGVIISGGLVGLGVGSVTLFLYGSMTRAQHAFLKRASWNFWRVLVAFAVFAAGTTTQAQAFYTWLGLI
jgi:hypothetical protein